MDSEIHVEMQKKKKMKPSIPKETLKMKEWYDFEGLL